MAWLRKRGRRTLGIAAATSAASALTACSPDAADDGDSGDREAKYKRAVEDPHPRPADVIEAIGAPADVVRADDGSLLLTYDAGNIEDDEGPAASAWRIVGPDGRTVAEHAEHTDAQTVPAGRPSSTAPPHAPRRPRPAYRTTPTATPSTSGARPGA